MDSRDKQRRAALNRHQGMTALAIFYLATIGGLVGSALTIL